MAFFEIGRSCHQVYQVCTHATDDDDQLFDLIFSTGKVNKAAKALVAIDALVGITLLVLGILALQNQLPLQPGIVNAFAYTSIALGALNFGISLFKCLQKIHMTCVEWQKKKGKEGVSYTGQ